MCSGEEGWQSPSHSQQMQWSSEKEKHTKRSRMSTGSSRINYTPFNNGYSQEKAISLLFSLEHCQLTAYRVKTSCSSYVFFMFLLCSGTLWQISYCHVYSLWSVCTAFDSSFLFFFLGFRDKLQNWAQSNFQDFWMKTDPSNQKI